MKKEFKVGDTVVHKMGNMPRIGVIKSEPDTRKFWIGDGGNPLCFVGENHYFCWVEACGEYLTKT